MGCRERSTRRMSRVSGTPGSRQGGIRRLRREGRAGGEWRGLEPTARRRIATGTAWVDGQAFGDGLTQLLQELGAQRSERRRIACAQGFALGEAAYRLQRALRRQREPLTQLVVGLDLGRSLRCGERRERIPSGRGACRQPLQFRRQQVASVRRGRLQGLREQRKLARREWCVGRAQRRSQGAQSVVVARGAGGHIGQGCVISRSGRVLIARE